MRMTTKVTERMLPLFDSTGAGEKGSGEWATFTAVANDRISMFRVARPQKTFVARGPRNILHIITPPRPRRLRLTH
jgi:hypothetical protein